MTKHLQLFFHSYFLKPFKVEHSKDYHRLYANIDLSQKNLKVQNQWALYCSLYQAIYSRVLNLDEQYLVVHILNNIHELNKYSSCCPLVYSVLLRHQFEQLSILSILNNKVYACLCLNFLVKLVLNIWMLNNSHNDTYLSTLYRLSSSFIVLLSIILMATC